MILIDTEAMREQAKAALSYAEAKIGGAHEAYEWAARNVITLCDALDAARAALLWQRQHATNNEAWERANEALGEEKQR